MRISQVVFSTPLKKIRTFLQSLRRKFTKYFNIRIKLHHILFQLCTKDVTRRPVEISLSVFVDKYIGIDAADFLNGGRLWHKWTFRFLCDSNSNGKTPSDSC